MTQPTETKKNPTPSPMGFLAIYIRGVLMGAADVIPGVSGGTIALIVGIYERFIGAIASITKESIPAWKRGGLKEVWRAIDGTFLVTLGAGIATSFITVAHSITWMLEHYPQLLWSFFFGLVLATCPFIGRMVKQWNATNIISLVVAAAVTFWITSATPATTPDAYWFIFLSGVLAISAMILPGISGSFILVLLGKYAYMLDAIRSFNIPLIIIFLAGCFVGITTSSRLISWLFKRFHNLALAIIIGIMIGSLNKVWPWKQTLEWRTSSEGVLEPLVQVNIWPTNYFAATGQPSFVGWCILLALLGGVLIFAIEYVRTRVEHKKHDTL